MFRDNHISHLLKLSVATCFLMLTVITLSAQEEPPRPIQLSTYQHLSFGAFINGYNGGTVSVEPGGNRSVTGDIIPVFQGSQFHPAIFEVEANPGTIINIVNGPDIILAGSNGGSIMLHLDGSLPVSPFINSTRPPFRTQVMIGGTITVGNTLANPPGEYTGNFFVTFIQE